MRCPAWILIGQRLGRGTSAALPPWSPAVLWGCGLFETVGCEDGAPLLWDAHVQRLRRGMSSLDWPPTRLPDRPAVERLLARCGVARSGALRVVAARLPGRVRVMSWAVPFRPPRRLRHRGARLATVSLPTGPLAGLKATAYLAHRWARQQARRRGTDAALLVDADGAIREADAANLFVLSDGVVATPPAPRRCLPGVMRAWCLAELAAEGITVAERDLTVDDVHQAEEAWLTSSLAGIVPVAAVDDRPVPTPRRIVALLERVGVPAPGYRRT